VRSTSSSKALLVIALFAAACGDDDVPALDPLFPADYTATFVEVRDCRPSADHDLNNIRVLADPAALAPYRDREAPFPTGALLLKEEHDFGDTNCTGEPTQWTVMEKLADDSEPDQLDWRWQKVNLDRVVLSQDDPRCFGCHELCTEPPDSYLFTCAVP
jgi:hypothetical protein